MSGEETDHEEEDDRADDGDDQAADQAVPDLHADRPEEIAADECPDDADDDVAEETEAVASHELTGQPACNRADDDEPKVTHGILLSLSEALIGDRGPVAHRRPFRGPAGCDLDLDLSCWRGSRAAGVMSSVSRTSFSMMIETRAKSSGGTLFKRSMSGFRWPMSPRSVGRRLPGLSPSAPAMREKTSAPRSLERRLPGFSPSASAMRTKSST